MSSFNPIINSPYFEPLRHFAFDDKGMTSDIVDGRRKSEFFIPVPKSTLKRGRDEGSLFQGFTEETKKENELVNKIRDRITKRREGGYSGLTKISKELLEYRTSLERENKLFFCQIEAVESLMYVTECASKNGDDWIINQIKDENGKANPGLYRLALKMATGSGKTVVMAMIIAWQTLNKLNYRQDKRFTDAFVIIAPGVTIRDRLNVLEPGNNDNYYKKRDIVPVQFSQQLMQAKIVITNFHTLELRNSSRYGTTKVVKEEAKKESPSAMINRAFKSLKNKSNIMVINDEAHHCYQPNPTESKLKGEERKEAEENNEKAKVRISGIKYLNEKIGVISVVDMSATPFFLQGSGYKEGTLFPWVISDFSLVDAIECGIVKIPRLPVNDDTLNADPAFRNLRVNIRELLPKKGAKSGGYANEPVIPGLLQAAIETLYNHYEKSYIKYLEAKEVNPHVMPPVMIIVCNNTSVSKMVYERVSGYMTQRNDAEVIIPGQCEIFRNEKDGKWLNKANTLLIDSEALESSNDVDDTFKSSFAQEIIEFQKEYKDRFPGRDLPTDKELLREVMNTVGKKGKLGENIKCVISVSMLTEGRDVNTVTHVLGVRAFGTQLLCEQVVGRGLRRMSYDTDENGMMKPEYAEVFGVPFSFIPSSGDANDPQPPKPIHRVQSLESRNELEIQYPRILGYKYEFDETKLEAKFNDQIVTKVENIPTETTGTGITGEVTTYNLEDLRLKRKQEVVYHLTAITLRRYFKDDDGQEKYWMFNSLKSIVEHYINHHVRLGNNMFHGLLYLNELAEDAVSKIYQGIIQTTPNKKLIPILAPYDAIGSTVYVDFITTKPVQETYKSHVNYVVEDNAGGESNDREAGVAKKLEDMNEVIAYAKNQGLSFLIPYEYGGTTKNYIPDFVVRLKKADGAIIHLIIEVTGKKDDKKKVKTETAKHIWIPAINNRLEKYQGTYDGYTYGKRAFVEIQDPNETQNIIRRGLTHGFENIDKYTQGLFTTETN